MTLRLFSIFKMVYECENMSVAAKKLYMSQPAISHAIQELEEQLSLRLFERIGKHIQSTHAGDIMYQKACHMLMVYEEVMTSTQHIEEQTPLRIGSSITNANTILPKIVHAYEKRWKNPVQVVVDNAYNIEQKLYANEIDIAFLEGTLDSTALKTLPLPSYELQLFCGNEYPLKERASYKVEDIRNESWLLREKGSAIRACIDSVCLLSDVLLKPIWESVNSQSLIEAAIYNLGVSILPVPVLARDVEEGKIRTFSLVPPMNCANHIVYHKDKHLHTAIQQMFTLYNELYNDVAR